MAEERLITKQLIKNMLLNFIVFTIIFSTLGIILYTQIENSIYKSSDEELLNSRNKAGIIERINEDESNGKKDFQPPNSVMEENPKYDNRKEININPRLIFIVRDKEGEILDINPNNENYRTIIFDKNNINTIYFINLNNQYKYRAINYQTQKNGEQVYIQVLINVDAEEAIMQNFKKLLILSLVLSVGLALGASYILSKVTLHPIIESWKKQTEFVQNASHELRTPLTIIQAKQELLLEEPESKIIDKAEDISITLNETRRLSKLVKELMELARSDSNKTKIEKTNTNADELIERVVEPFIEIAESQGKKIELTLNYSRELKLDVNKIHELLVIILDNSIKYTEKGDTINIKTEEIDGKLDIQIADTGIGVSDETINHMFDRFYREDKARSRETGGSGLGLSIAQSIINEHGGTIKAKHNNPKGTIIEIKLKK